MASEDPPTGTGGIVINAMCITTLLWVMAEARLISSIRSAPFAKQREDNNLATGDIVLLFPYDNALLSAFLCAQSHECDQSCT